MTSYEISWLEDKSDEAILAEIRRVAALNPDRRLTKEAYNSQSKIKCSAVEKRFGSWSEATRKAGLAHALPEYTDASILDDLKRVSESFPNEPLTSVFYSKHGLYSVNSFKRRFGGWSKALKAAELGSRFVGPATTERMRSQPNRAVTNEEILVKIRDVFSRLGKPSISGSDIEANSDITQPLMYRRFGSVSAALRQAGIEQAAHGRRHTEDEVFENLLNVWTHYGRSPTVSEMDKPPSTIGKNTYLHRYGGWRKALKAFVERINAESNDEPSKPLKADASVKPNSLVTNQLASRSRKARVQRTIIKPEDRRDPSIGLRFQVLKRDQFRCKLCGRSPATELGCKLHVDHIIPFSKGGKTTFDNLQTLCSHCNIGKSNRTI